MQDMATMQQHATSPAPATTSTGTQDAPTKSVDAEDMQQQQHETTRTDSEVTEGEEVPCPACAASLPSQHDLTLHLRAHHGGGDGGSGGASGAQQQFVCGVCGKALSSASSRDRHALVHSGERPFRCRVCGVAFTTNGNMHRHMRTHGAAALDCADDASMPKRRRESSCSSSGALSPLSPVSAAKRKASSDEDEVTAEGRRRAKSLTPEGGLQCPACERCDFPGLGALEAHMEEAHADAQASASRCDICGVSLRNQRALNLHKYMVHSRRGAVVGFQDLTFVDFSSEKFPLIARAVCEQSMHRSNSEYLRFQCSRCDRAFPCNSALSIHLQNCGAEHQGDEDAAPTDLSSRKSDDTADDEPEDKKRADFFHCLDLRNKSTPVPAAPVRREEAKSEAGRADLADIQSIISVTSAGSLLQDLSKSPPQSGGDLTPPDSAVKDEEQQDVFAAEFRRMKLRGEFPCRLCASVFPNLRALKGHSRMHLSAGCCNVCPFANSDRATLLRHMRSHNGDRPYECALCNYAFTTKANCERHLRNRHAKLSREEVKKSIIYHPSEDPTNDPDLQARLSLRQDVKRSLSFNHGIVSDDVHLMENSNAGSQHSVEDRRAIDDEDSTEDLNTKEPNKYFNIHEGNVHDVTISPRSPAASCLPTLIEERNHSSNPIRIVPALRVKKEELMDPDIKFVVDKENEDFHKIQTDADPLVNITPKSEESAFSKSIDDDQRLSTEEAKHSNSSYECDIDSPLDLSMDALDLSKKKRDSANYTNTCMTKDFEDSDEPEDLSKKSGNKFNSSHKIPNFDKNNSLDKSINSSVLNSHGSILAQHMLKNICNRGIISHQLNQSPTANIPKLDQSEYFSHFNPSYSLFPHTIFPMSHYIVPPQNHTIFPNNNFQDLSEMKERIQKELIRGLRLSSGGSLLDTISNYQKQQQQQQHSPLHPLSDYSQIQNDLKQKLNDESNHSLPLPVEEKANPIPVSQLSAAKPIQQRDTSSSVKMVIKNGVLMPKQKQRRYRTERPFACEHCSARFTLRSNMERHVKQQHPQLWSQRQRGNSGALVIGHTRRPSQPPPPPNVTCTDIREPLQHKIIPLTIDISQNDAKDTTINNNNLNAKAFISNEVKFAIAQKLAAPSKADEDEVRRNGTADEEADDESELVIDEGRTDTEAEAESRADLASVSRLLDAASEQTHAFQRYFQTEDGSEEDEDGLVAGSSDENRSESELVPASSGTKKKSAYSLAPNRVSCPYCLRKFPWSSSLRRHVLTHTGQKPYKCRFCPLLFTTKSNCDRHLLRKHGGGNSNVSNSNNASAGPTVASASGGTSSGSETSPGYSMRNVPERPYKCNHCPSSTFSTQSNLRKHLAAKHCASSPPLSPSATPITIISNTDESPVSGEENNCETRNVNQLLSTAGTVDDTKEVSPKPIITQSIESVSPPASELPFKCHLCEGSYGERQDALDHIKECHHAEYELLVSKGALEAAEDNNNINNVGIQEDTGAPGGDEGLDSIRGKFPDYANRKVMCAFCMRRFWSAEDLRRHMRTHTGERPFSCDVCRRRFTLKHSMLRHRKKHGGCASAGTAASGDEDCANNNNNNNHNNNNNTMVIPTTTTTKVRELEESDLIGNLLGIQDRSIIDKVLQAKSADAAAKLLGV